MRFAWPALFALSTLAALSGCRTAGVDNLAQRPPIAPKAALEASAVIAEHNRNAERIQTLEAQPSLSVSMDRGRPYGVDGRLAMEQPRNFKLDVSHMTAEVADIGSNDDTFWFWVRDNKDKAVYYCDYDQSASTVATLQPDWIVEALGLRVIPASEAAKASVAKGQDPDTTIVTLRPTRIGGETITRKLIVNEKTRRIREYRLYSEAGALLARASIEQYQRVTPVDAQPGADPVIVPQKLKLEWIREKLTMDVTFPPSTKVNAPFPEKRRQALFVEEPRQGYARRNLAEYARLPSREPATIRETRPAPPAGVELLAPAPVGIDNATRTPRDPVALSADLPALPSLSGDLVGPEIPSAPELHFSRPAPSGWRSSAGPSFER
jgi:outer membrane lipoprotein-sorting protein